MRNKTNRDKLRNERYLKAEVLYLNTNRTLRSVCEEYNIAREEFSKYLKSKNISTRKRIDSCDTKFENISSEEQAYWLGFLYADGSLTYKENFPTRYVVELSLQKNDKEHLEKFKLFMNSKRKIEFRERLNAFRIIISSKKTCSDLIKLGCTPKKSLTLTFPNEKQLPKKLINHFIRGYFDGDGHISLRKNTNGLQTIQILGTKEFLESLVSIKKINCSLKKDLRHKGNTFYISLNVLDGTKLLKDMYQKSTIHLTRKYEKYLLAVQHRNKLNYERAKTVKGEIPNTVLNTIK